MTKEEAQIVREAIDTLKEKWQESEGAWSLCDFMSAAGDKSHWMHKVISADKLVDEVLGERND